MSKTLQFGPLTMGQKRYDPVTSNVLLGQWGSSKT